VKFTSTIIHKSDLADLLASLLAVNEPVGFYTAIRTELHIAYDAGFRSALAAIATAYGLNVPEIRESEAVFQRQIRLPSEHDPRL